MSNDDDLPSVKRLLLLSVPSVLNEAAPFASALCQTALLSHAGEAFRRAGRSYSSEEAVAAFGAVTQTTNFVTGLFNFLLMVVMAGVGKAMGSKRWRAAGRHVRLALPLALGLGSAAGILLACARGFLLDAVLRLSPGARAAAWQFFIWRCSCLPAAFVLKALVGVLGGFGMLGHLTVLSVGQAAVEVGLAAASLRLLPSHHHHHDDGSNDGGGGEGGGGDDDEDDDGTMGGFGATVAAFGAASLVASTLAVVAGVAIVFTRTPPAARRHLRPRHCNGGGADSSGGSGHKRSGHYALAVGDNDDGRHDDGSGAADEEEERAAVAAATPGKEEDDDDDDDDDDGGGGGGGKSEATEGFSLSQFLRNAADTMVRSLLLQSSMWAMTVAAARLGTGPLAAHQVVSLLWLVVSYVVDGVADLGTMYGSRLLGAGRPGDFGVLAGRVRAMGGAVGALAALVLWCARGAIQAGLAPDGNDGMLRQLRGAWPLLAAMQLCNSLVFIYDGLLSAAHQFRFVRDVFLAGVLGLFAPTLALVLVPHDGVPGAGTLVGVWSAKAVLNVWRCGTAVWRIDFALPRQWKQKEDERVLLSTTAKSTAAAAASDSDALSESLLPAPGSPGS